MQRVLLNCIRHVITDYYTDNGGTVIIGQEPREGTGQCEACKRCQLEILGHLKRSASIFEAHSTSTSGETRIMTEAVAVFGERRLLRKMCVMSTRKRDGNVVRSVVVVASEVAWESALRHECSAGPRHPFSLIHLEDHSLPFLPVVRSSVSL